jgi:GNAT superfamily N-acetyltransferase
MTALPGLVIRDVAVSDQERLIDLFQALNQYEQPFSGDRRVDRGGAAEALRAAQRRVAQTGGAAMVAVLDGEIVGHIFVTVDQFGDHVREELRRYAYVAELFVCERQRRRGIGAALVAAAERFARGRNLRRIMIGVLAGNETARAAYRGYGFHPYASELIKDLEPQD